MRQTARCPSLVGSRITEPIEPQQSHLRTRQQARPHLLRDPSRSRAVREAQALEKTRPPVVSNACLTYFCVQRLQGNRSPIMAIRGHLRPLDTGNLFGSLLAALNDWCSGLADSISARDNLIPLKMPDIRLQATTRSTIKSDCHSYLREESIVRYECDRRGCGCNALLKMRAGPSESAYRSGLQITSSCVGQESTW